MEISELAGDVGMSCKAVVEHLGLGLEWPRASRSLLEII